MRTAEHYEAIIEAIGEKLVALESDLFYKDLEIKGLKEKLEAAEKALAEKEGKSNE